MAKFKLQNWWLGLSLAKKLRCFWLLGIFLILGLVFWFKIIPSGNMMYGKNYKKTWQSGKGFIYNFTPKDRVDEKSSRYPRIMGDPVYFSVFSPRSFSRAKVTVVYESNLTENTPIIEVGVLSDPIVWRYNLKPLENRIIEKLDQDWFKITDQDLTLWQREPNYQDLNHFLSDLEKKQLLACQNNIRDCIATYNYQPNVGLLVNEQLEVLKNKNDLSLQTVNPVALRGPHTILLDLKEDSSLQLKINLKSFNVNNPIKQAKILLFNHQELIAEANWLREDSPGNNLTAPESINLSLHEPELRAGIYKLEIKINNDVIIEKLESSADANVFINKVWPVAVEDKITLFTDSSYLQIKAMSPASLQSFNFNEEVFLIDKTYQQQEVRLQESFKINKIELEKDNIILENNGVFSFFENQLFNPSLKRVDRFFSVNSELKYILASYESPFLKPGGERQAVAEFSLFGAYREKGKYNFMISIPGLRAEDDQDDYLVIKEIKIEMQGRSLWEKIFNLPDKYK